MTFHSPSPSVVSTVVAIYEIGGFFGSVFTSFAGDKFGRRQMVGTGAVCLIIGAIIQASSYELAQLIVGRIIAGCGVGMLQSTLPILPIARAVTPMAVRGVYAAVYLSFLNLGGCIAYWLNFGLSYLNTDFSWRFPTAFQLIFSISILILSFIVPESPRWLALHDMNEDALTVIATLKNVANDDHEVMQQYHEIKEAAIMEMSLGSGSWMDFIKEDSMSTRRTSLVCLLGANM